MVVLALVCLVQRQYLDDAGRRYHEQMNRVVVPNTRSSRENGVLFLRHLIILDHLQLNPPSLPHPPLYLSFFSRCRSWLASAMWIYSKQV